MKNNEYVIMLLINIQYKNKWLINALFINYSILHKHLRTFINLFIIY